MAKTAKTKKKKTTVYTVVELAYDYNDEYMYATEAGGGHVVCAYRTKAKASEVIEEKSLAAYKEVDPRDYYPEDCYLPGDTVSGLNALGGPFKAVLESIDDLYGIWDDLTEEDRIAAWKVIDAHGNTFYKIQETELE